MFLHPKSVRPEHDARIVERVVDWDVIKNAATSSSASLSGIHIHLRYGGCCSGCCSGVVVR